MRVKDFFILEMKKNNLGSDGRIKYIDIAKGVGVLFVLIDHIQYFFPVNNSFMILRVIWIAFFLQVFFIVTGITARYPIITSGKDILGFIEKKFKALIVPYIIWSFFLNMSGRHDILFFFKIILGRSEDLDSVGVNSVLWFFPVLFMANVITFFAMTTIHYIQKRTNINISIYYMVMIVILVIIDRKSNAFFGDYLFFGLRSAFCASALIFLGMLLKEVVNIIYTKLSIIRKVFLFAIFFIIGMPLAYLNMPVLYDSGNIGYSYAVWMGMGLLGKNVILFLIASFCMSMCVIIFSMCLEKISILSYCGKRSLLFMTVHIYTHNIVAANIFPLIKQYIGDVGQTTDMVLFLILSILLIIVLLPFIDRYMPFLYKPVGK